MPSITRFTVGTLLLVLSAACADAPTAAPLAQPGTDLQSSGASDRARFLVRLADTDRDVPGLARATVAAHGGELHHVFESIYKGFSATLPRRAAEALRHNLRVEYVEELQFMPFAIYEQYNAPWHLDRIDQPSLPLNGMYRTYNHGTTNGINATDTAEIYIIDSGIRPTHTEFTGRAVAGYDARPSDSRGGLPYGWDCNRHGTHVAGLAGGVTYGVAKKARIIGVRVGYECQNGGYPDDLIRGIDWVRSQKLARPSQIMVANISMGGTASQSIDDAVRRLISAGVNTAVAAGNNLGNACNLSPARVSEAYTIGASSPNDSRWLDTWNNQGSNYGSCLDGFAPGDQVLSAYHTGDADTIRFSGTSMAAPQVAGALAAGRISPAYNGSTLKWTEGVLTSIGTGSPNKLLYTGENWLPYWHGPVCQPYDIFCW